MSPASGVPDRRRPFVAAIRSPLLAGADRASARWQKRLASSQPRAKSGPAAISRGPAGWNSRYTLGGDRLRSSQIEDLLISKKNKSRPTLPGLGLERKRGPGDALATPAGKTGDNGQPVPGLEGKLPLPAAVTTTKKGPVAAPRDAQPPGQKTAGEDIAAEPTLPGPRPLAGATGPVDKAPYLPSLTGRAESLENTEVNEDDLSLDDIAPTEINLPASAFPYPDEATLLDRPRDPRLVKNAKAARAGGAGKRSRTIQPPQYRDDSAADGEAETSDSFLDEEATIHDRPDVDRLRSMALDAALSDGGDESTVTDGITQPRGDTPPALQNPAADAGSNRVGQASARSFAPRSQVVNADDSQARRTEPDPLHASDFDHGPTDVENPNTPPPAQRTPPPQLPPAPNHALAAPAGQLEIAAGPGALTGDPHFVALPQGGASGPMPAAPLHQLGTEPSSGAYPQAPPEWTKRPSPWAGSETEADIGEGMRHTKKVALVGGAISGATVLLLLLLLAIATAISGSDSEPELPIASRALELYQQGKADEALALLSAEDHAAEVAGDSQAQLLLGHISFAQSQALEGLNAYQRAIALERARSRDDALGKNVRAALASQQRKVLDGALDLLGAVLVAPDGTAQKDASDHPLTALVVDAASRHKNYTTRRTANAIAKKSGLDERIDRLTSYLLDLRQGRRCKDRRRSVGKLRKLGDRRAVAALQAAIKGEGMAPRAKGNNRCLRKAAQQAIDHLQGKTSAEESGGSAKPPTPPAK